MINIFIRWVKVLLQIT